MGVEVFIVGGNHHNGLGLARSLGVNGIKVNSVVVGNEKKSFLSKSKYVKTCKVCKSEKEAFDYIKTVDVLNEDCNILIPYSDGAALELDNRLNDFKDKWVVPSINEEEGKISEFMSKINQYEFAIKNDVKIAKGQLIDLKESNIKFDLNYPCILKPNISAQGSKKDIVICKSKDDLDKALKTLVEKGYKEIFAQEFLDIDYEIDVFGCICKNYPYVTLTPTQTIRAWPAKKGTNSFSKIITDKDIIEKCKKIIERLQTINFYGFYDIELFVMPITNEIYLNEINFRNSGDVYMGLNQKYYYPYIWVNDVRGISNEGVLDHPLREDYCMTELSDFRNVLSKNCKYKQWRKDYKRTKDYALRYKGDMKPVYYRYWQYFTRIFKRSRG